VPSAALSLGAGHLFLWINVRPMFKYDGCRSALEGESD
jgi:hypothetical protein